MGQELKHETEPFSDVRKCSSRCLGMSMGRMEKKPKCKGTQTGTPSSRTTGILAKGAMFRTFSGNLSSRARKKRGGKQRWNKTK